MRFIDRDGNPVEPNLEMDNIVNLTGDIIAVIKKWDSKSGLESNIRNEIIVSALASALSNHVSFNAIDPQNTMNMILDGLKIGMSQSLKGEQQ